MLRLALAEEKARAKLQKARDEEEQISLLAHGQKKKDQTGSNTTHFTETEVGSKGSDKDSKIVKKADKKTEKTSIKLVQPVRLSLAKRPAADKRVADKRRESKEDSDNDLDVPIALLNSTRSHAVASPAATKSAIKEVSEAEDDLDVPIGLLASKMSRIVSTHVATRTVIKEALDSDDDLDVPIGKLVSMEADTTTATTATAPTATAPAAIEIAEDEMIDVEAQHVKNAVAHTVSEECGTEKTPLLAANLELAGKGHASEEAANTDEGVDTEDDEEGEAVDMETVPVVVVDAPMESGEACADSLHEENGSADSTAKREDANNHAAEIECGDTPCNADVASDAQEVSPLQVGLSAESAASDAASGRCAQQAKTSCLLTMDEAALILSGGGWSEVDKKPAESGSQKRVSGRARKSTIAKYEKSQADADKTEADSSEKKGRGSPRQAPVGQIADESEVSGAGEAQIPPNKGRGRPTKNACRNGKVDENVAGEVGYGAAEADGNDKNGASPLVKQKSKGILKESAPVLRAATKSSDDKRATKACNEPMKHFAKRSGSKGKPSRDDPKPSTSDREKRESASVMSGPKGVKRKDPPVEDSDEDDLDIPLTMRAIARTETPKKVVEDGKKSEPASLKAQQVSVEDGHVSGKAKSVKRLKKDKREDVAQEAVEKRELEPRGQEELDGKNGRKTFGMHQDAVTGSKKRRKPEQSDIGGHKSSRSGAKIVGKNRMKETCSHKADTVKDPFDHASMFTLPQHFVVFFGMDRMTRTDMLTGAFNYIKKVCLCASCLRRLWSEECVVYSCAESACHALWHFIYVRNKYRCTSCPLFCMSDHAVSFEQGQTDVLLFIVSCCISV